MLLTLTFVFAAFFQNWLTPLPGTSTVPTQTNPSGHACTVGIDQNVTYTVPVPATYWACSGSVGHLAGTYQVIGGASGVNTPSFSGIPKALSGTPTLGQATAGDVITALGGTGIGTTSTNGNCVIGGTFPNQTLTCTGGSSPGNIAAQTFLANPLTSVGAPTSTTPSAALGLLGDDINNTSALGASAIFEKTIYMNRVINVTVGTGQTTLVRQANCVAMQAALTAGPANGWDVRIPPGIYEIDCATGLQFMNTNYDQALNIYSSDQAHIVQFHVNAPAATFGDITPGASDYSANIHILGGLRFEYGVSQTGQTGANLLQVGALRHSELDFIWLGADGAGYTAPLTPYAFPAYRAFYMVAGASQEFSNHYSNWHIQGAQYRLVDMSSRGTGSVFVNWYTTNGYYAQPGQLSDCAWFINGGDDGVWGQINIESVASNCVVNGQTLRGGTFAGVHLESIQLTGANPTLWIGGTNRLHFTSFDATGLYIPSSTLNTLAAPTGTATLFKTYQDDAISFGHLAIELQNAGNVVGIPFQLFTTNGTGDYQPSIEADIITADDFVTGGLLTNISLDGNTPQANFPGFTRISHYRYNPTLSQVYGEFIPIASNTTMYGQLINPNYFVPAAVTSFTLTLAGSQAASGVGSTVAPPTMDIVHVRRDVGTASGTVTITDGVTSTVLATNTTSATDSYFKYSGTRWCNASDTSCTSGGASGNATSFNGIPITGTATPGATYVLNPAGTAFILQTLTTVANGLGVCFSGGATATGNICENSRSVSATSDPLLNSDGGGLVAYTASSPTSVTLGQAGLGGNFINGWTAELTNYGSATVTVTASVSNFISSAGSSHVQTIVPGQTVKIVSDNTNFKVASITTASTGTTSNIPGQQVVTLGSASNIAGGITACGTSVSCSIIVPPNYTTSDTMPGFSIDPNNPTSTTTSNNISIFDQRSGNLQMQNNVLGYHQGLLYSPNAWQANISSVLTPLGQYVMHNIFLNNFDGGSNLQNSTTSYYNKTTYAPLGLINDSYSNGQHLGIANTLIKRGVGDGLGIANYVHCYGGFNAQADEGCEAADNQVFQGNVAFGGTISGSPGTGATSVAISPTQGSGTQGSGRYVVDLTQAYSTGTISAVSYVSSGPSTITGTGTSWPVSTATGTLTAISAPGSVTVTPTFTTGTISAVTTSTLVCVSDGGNFEKVLPTAVSGSTFTATFRKPHSTPIAFGVGGECGMNFDQVADDMTDAIWTGAGASKLQTITGTIRPGWPVISSTATTLSVSISGGGAYQQWISRFDASTANTYKLLPAAEVISAAANSAPSNTLTLEPNNVAWASGDTIEELLYPATHFVFGNDVVESYMPSFPGTAQGSGRTFNQLLQGNDTLWKLTLNAPKSFYSMYGGKYTEPNGLYVGAPTSVGLTFAFPAKNWQIQSSCDTAITAGANGSCTGTQNILAAQNASNYDFMTYDAGNKRYQLSYNGNAGHYTFGSTSFVGPGFTIPSSPSLVAGTNVSSITGTWPNQTINVSTGSGGGVNTGTIGQPAYYSTTTSVSGLLGAPLILAANGIVCDGTTDQTSAIQTLYNSVATNNSNPYNVGDIVWPTNCAGVVISNTIVLRNGLKNHISGGPVIWKGAAATTTGTISGGSLSTLTVASATNIAVGNNIWIYGAGCSGSCGLATTVAAISGTTVTLTDAATAAVTSQRVNTMPVFIIASDRSAVVSSFFIRTASASTYPMGNAFQIQQDTVTSGANSQLNTFENNFVDGISSGGLQTCFALVTGTLQSNSDNSGHSFINNSCNNFSFSALSTDNSQETDLQLTKNVFQANRISGTQCYYNLIGAGITAINNFCGGATVAVWNTSSQVAHPLTVINGADEDDQMLATVPYQLAPTPISFINERFSTRLAGTYTINYAPSGPLNIIGGSYGQNNTTCPIIVMTNTAAYGQVTGVVDSGLGCGGTPLLQIYTPAAGTQMQQFGNVYVNSSGNIVLPTTPDVNHTTGATQVSTIYKAAGIAVPTCNAAAAGTELIVSDATSHAATYASGGSITTKLLCTGSTWYGY